MVIKNGTEMETFSTLLIYSLIKSE
jgi:hypothetical protein